MVEIQVKFNTFSWEKPNSAMASWCYMMRSPKMHFLDFVSVNVYSLSNFSALAVVFGLFVARN